MYCFRLLFLHTEFLFPQHITLHTKLYFCIRITENSAPVKLKIMSVTKNQKQHPQKDFEHLIKTSINTNYTHFPNHITIRVSYTFQFQKGEK